MPAIKQQHQVSTLTEQRKAADVSLHKSQRKTETALATVQELQSKMQSEADFRKRLEEKYDAAVKRSSRRSPEPTLGGSPR